MLDYSWRGKSELGISSSDLQEARERRKEGGRGWGWVTKGCLYGTCNNHHLNDHKFRQDLITFRNFNLLDKNLPLLRCTSLYFGLCCRDNLLYPCSSTHNRIRLCFFRGNWKQTCWDFNRHNIQLDRCCNWCTTSLLHCKVHLPQKSPQNEPKELKV